ncbi:MAG: filamentous hemagglutinin N-terminal domain-containing protein [Cyanobacteriota bacterium]
MSSNRSQTSEPLAQQQKIPTPWGYRWWIGIAVAFGIGGAIAFSANPTVAQITPDATLGNESSRVTPNPNVRGLPAELIQGGATRGVNLFHSFTEFNVGNGQRVYFANPVGIENILSRVTGNNLSNILGTLGVDGGASLFLLNPNGIIFGQNARLDIAGSFVASTANALAFENGTGFSATNPEAPPLLTISLTPGLQYGTNQPRATIANSGNLAVGQNLTLSAGNLDLQGQLQAGRDLTLFAQDLVKVRDSVTHPFIASSGGQLLIQGNQGIDIFALNHLNSGFFSGGDMVLRSASTVGGDAHYWSGGSFQIQKLDGTLGNLDSPHDPIILVNGDVSLGDYTGASLHILAGGSVTLGNVEITGTDSGENTINPNNPDPFLASLATVPLPDGTTLTIDGSTKSTLDVRAGIDWTTFPPGTLGNRTVGTVAPTPAFAGATSADITVNGNIRVAQPRDINLSQPEGVVLLTNQYRHNGLAGNILTQNITTEARHTFGIDSGTITINSRGNITTNNLDSFAYNGFGYPVSGGAITLHASNGDITTGGIEASTSVDSISGNGGDISFTAINGNITVAGDIRSTSIGNSSTGKGGLVSLTAIGNTPNTGDIIVEGKIDTTAFSRYGGMPWVKARMGEGGDVVLSADNVIDVGMINIAGNVADQTNYNYGNINLTANEIYLGEGRGKTITLTAADIITAGFLDSSSFKDNGGTINLTAGGDISVGFLDSSFSGDGTGNGNGGAINITSREGTIFAEDGVIKSTTFGMGNAGNINIHAPSVSLVNTEVTTTASGIGNSGSISIVANDSILLDRSRLFTSVAPGTTGTGGNITLEAQSVSLSNFSFIDTATFGQGDAGNVLIQAEELVSLDKSSIFSITAGQGNAGKVTVQARENTLAPNVTLTNRSNMSTAVNSTAQGNGGDIRINARSLDITGGSQLQALTRGEGDTANTRGNSGKIAIAADSVAISGISADGFLSGVFTSTNATNSGKGGTINITTPGTLLVADGAVLSAQTASTFGGGDIFVQANQVELRNGGQFLTSTTSSGQAGNITVEAAERVTISGTDPNFNNRVSPNTLVPACAVAGIPCGTSTNPDVDFSTRIPYVSISATGTGEADIYTFEVAAGTRAIFDIDNGDKPPSPPLYQENLESVNTWITLLDSQQNELRTNDDALVSLGEGGSEARTTGGKLSLSRDSYFRYVFTEPGRYSIEVSEANGEGVKVGGTYTLQVSLETPNVTGSVIDANPASGLFARTQGDGAAGNVTINTQQLSVTDGAQVSASTSGSGQGGSLTVTAPQAITLSNNSQLSVETSNVGAAGDVKLSTDTLTVEGGARVTATATATATTTEQGGSISVNANQFNLSDTGGLLAETQGAAPAGSLTLQPYNNEQSLTVHLQDGAQISASTSGSGTGGSLTVTAPESITITGNGTLAATAQASSTGQAGDVKITTPQLTVANGARVSASTNSTNPEAIGGSLEVQAEQVNLNGNSSLSAGTTGAAPGGNLIIQPLGNSQTLTVNFQDGSTASAATSGSGKGGTVTVTAPQEVILSGNGSLISAETTGSGTGGDISIETGQLTIRDGAQVRASASSSGNGGNLTVNSSDSVQLRGENSGLFVNATAGSTAGNLTVTTRQMSVFDGAQVTVSSPSGQAGNLSITADTLLLNRGTLSAVTGTSGAEGGANITLSGLEFLRMDNESLISASALENANGGNISIHSTFIVATPPTGSQGSDIIANAEHGKGGQVNITTQGLFGIEFRSELTPDNDITVSSTFGLSGEYILNSPGIDPSRGLAELPTNVTDATELIDRRCTPARRNDQRSSFTITGRGGIPSSPNDTLQGESVITNWVTLDSEEENNTPSTPTTPKSSVPQQLVEAQGWLINEQGQVVLTATAPQVTPQDKWLSPPECNPPQNDL